MSIMTEEEEEMDYQIELHELYSNKNDSVITVENLYEFTESELSRHDSEVRAATIRNFGEWLVKNMFNGCYKLPMCMGDFITEYEREQKDERIREEQKN